MVLELVQFRACHQQMYGLLHIIFINSERQGCSTFCETYVLQTFQISGRNILNFEAKLLLHALLTLDEILYFCWRLTTSSIQRSDIFILVSGIPKDTGPISYLFFWERVGKILELVVLLVHHILRFSTMQIGRAPDLFKNQHDGPLSMQNTFVDDILPSTGSKSLFGFVYYPSWWYLLIIKLIPRSFWIFSGKFSIVAKIVLGRETDHAFEKVWCSIFFAMNIIWYFWK